MTGPSGSTGPRELVEHAGDHHAVSANASATERSRLLAVFVVDTEDRAYGAGPARDGPVPRARIPPSRDRSRPHRPMPQTTRRPPPSRPIVPAPAPRLPHARRPQRGRGRGAGGLAALDRGRPGRGRRPLPVPRPIVTRLCLDQMKCRPAPAGRPYVGPWLPEPLIEEEPGVDEDDLTHDLDAVRSNACRPLERAAFLLHDVFGLPLSAPWRHTLGREGRRRAPARGAARRNVRAARPRFPGGAGGRRADRPRLLRRLRERGRRSPAHPAGAERGPVLGRRRQGPAFRNPIAGIERLLPSSPRPAQMGARPGRDGSRLSGSTGCRAMSAASAAASSNDGARDRARPDHRHLHHPQPRQAAPRRARPRRDGRRRVAVVTRRRGRRRTAATVGEASNDGSPSGADGRTEHRIQDRSEARRMIARHAPSAQDADRRRRTAPPPPARPRNPGWRDAAASGDEAGGAQILQGAVFT